MAENRPLAILLFVLAGAAIVAMSASVRFVSADLGTGQIMFWRSATSVPVILAYMIWRGSFPVAFKTQRLRAHGLRMGLAVSAMACSFGSLAYLPVALATAIGFLAPVLVLILAAAFLGEALSGVRVAATLLGLAGVAVVTAHALTLPGEGALVGVFLALGFAFLLAVARIVVKDLSRTERPETIAIFFAMGGTAVGALTAIMGWVPLATPTLGVLALAGLFGALAHILSAEAVSRAPISLLAPIEYTELIWAAGLDLVIFQTVPGPLALLGMGVITLSGLLVWWGRRR